MARYIIGLRSEWWETEPFSPNLQVDHAPPQDTGLKGPHGETIYRVPDQIGFIGGNHTMPCKPKGKPRPKGGKK